MLLPLSVCESSPSKINLKKLTSKEFKLFRVFYMTLFDETRTGSQIFISLPIQDVVQEVEKKYGINIDASLFSDIESNVSKIKSYNLAVRNYFLQCEISDPQIATISFNRINPDEISIEIVLYIFEGDKIKSKGEYTINIPNF
jgi:hypothetical protein